MGFSLLIFSTLARPSEVGVSAWGSTAHSAGQLQEGTYTEQEGGPWHPEAEEMATAKDGGAAPGFTAGPRHG